MPIPEAHKALAAKFAGSLERKPAARSVDELSEADLHDIDSRYAADKASGALDQRQADRAMRDEVQHLRCIGGL